MAIPQTLFDLIWPDADRARPLAPVRVGMDRFTGKVIIGERHEAQSLGVIFATRIHERVCRRWVGSFVPHILGDNTTERTVGRFYWAIYTGTELYEPNQAIRRIHIARRGETDLPLESDSLSSAEEIRSGHMTVKLETIRYPRGHLGDFTPEGRRRIGLIGRGRGIWERVAV